MITPRVLFCVAAVCAAAILAGCGGGDNASKATPAAASASPVATTEAQRELASLPLAQAVPIPQGLKCSGDVVVWVNLKSKSFHDAADPYFGRTKLGKYMCKTDAVTAGYHAAGAKRSRKHSPEPSATASGY